MPPTGMPPSVAVVTTSRANMRPPKDAGPFMGGMSLQLDDKGGSVTLNSKTGGDMANGGAADTKAFESRESLLEYVTAKIMGISDAPPAAPEPAAAEPMAAPAAVASGPVQERL